MKFVVEFVFIFLTLYATLAHCRNCNVDSFAVQANFNITKFMGAWYEIKWIPDVQIPPEQRYRDYKHTYGAATDSGNITMKISGRDPSKEGCFYFNLYLLKTKTPAKFLKTRPKGNPTDYWIMETDYDNYAIAYGCLKRNTSDGTCINPQSWVWSRGQTLSGQLMNVADSKILSLCLNLTAFQPTEQKEDCPSDKASALRNPLLFLNYVSMYLVYQIVTK